MGREDFQRRLAEAVRELHDQVDPPHTLQRMVEITPEFFDSCDFVGVSLIEPDRIRTPAATNELLRQLDDSQFELEQGPCYEAIRNDPVVIIGDLATDSRWPIWGRAMVLELGVRASLSFRLFTRHDRSWGALNLYSRTPHAFSEVDVQHGQVVAAMCAVALAKAINDHQLATALESRTVIGQAMGMLMERYGLDEHAAFAAMRRISSQDNRKLRDLAAQIVSDRDTPIAPAPDPA
ncbi:GAF and ANTAR domain-containing protein [Nocardioides hwasunensis]|uniref:GAF and ANTAR domain-containing protein n=1 Tax=Nocardioides hwasunensis TaxID=397258 RepID=A0ABR8MI18_9ACTN|nr:ANTAR domain-containing protein [Nocardioides hwasunensis]MBD3915702.1 GAF and ANTAR domain-containing protein [Nocardioides hwasunensis]